MTDSWGSDATFTSDWWNLEATATVTNETGQPLRFVTISSFSIETQQISFTTRPTVWLFQDGDLGQPVAPGGSISFRGQVQVMVATDSGHNEEARKTPTQRAWQWGITGGVGHYADIEVSLACPAPKVIAEPF